MKKRKENFINFVVRVLWVARILLLHYIPERVCGGERYTISHDVCAIMHDMNRETQIGDIYDEREFCATKCKCKPAHDTHSISKMVTYVI